MSPSKTAAERWAEDLGAFVSASPSSFHAVREAARRLEEAGFTELYESDDWAGGPGEFFTVRDGALVAWVAPDGADDSTSFSVLGAHTDSPALKLKPSPDISAHGFQQVGVEVYGGPLLNSWLDRELLLAGVVVTTDGTEHLVRTGPVLRVPQLAIHLDRSVNAEGLKLDAQKHLQPVLGLGRATGHDVLDLLADAAGLETSDIAAWDVVTAAAEAPGVFGADRDFFASPRLDNLSSVHAGVQALSALGAAGARSDAPIAVLVANDHEEVGSATRSGAAGPFLEDVLVRIHAGLGGDEISRRRAFASSVVVSADAGHGIHPNFAERHDPTVRPRLGGGPMVKINAQQRYASDAHGISLWRRVSEAAEVPFQEFVSNNTVPCGSTIGPLTATRLGMRTLDVGIPLLSMHSAREMCAVADPVALGLAAREFLAGTR
jgi:aspartyl aminopeptidase